jgi:hypothetical protein
MRRHLHRGLAVNSVAGVRSAHTNMFERREHDGDRRKHDHRSLPIDDASFWGGRSAHMRYTGPQKGLGGPKWMLDRSLEKYNIDVWLAQQTLRKKWKGRDWDVVELPFQHAPKELQQVIPEKHTELPRMVNASAGDCRNVRSVVYDRESLQEVLYPGRAKPYPELRSQHPDEAKLALDSFFES